MQFSLRINAIQEQQCNTIINEQEKETLSFLRVLHAAKVKLDQSQSIVIHIPFSTPTRTPLGLAAKTRNFLTVFWTWFVNIKVLQTSPKICEQDLCRLHKNLACMLPEHSKRPFVLIVEHTGIKMPKESWNKSKINMSDKGTQIYIW